MEKLTGLIAAPFTPLDEKGELALEKIETIAQLYSKNQVAGAFICGTTGECASLSLQEKLQVVEAWGKLKRPDLKIIAMLGGTCLKDMQELSRFAMEQGMDGTAILSPYYFKPNSVQTLVDFCREVAETSPDLPFYYYHIPGLTGVHFSMLEFLRLADEVIPNLAGVKFSAMNIVDFHACRMYKDGKYDLLWGTDEAMLSALAVGTKGVVGSTYNYAAPLYHQIIKAFENRNFEEAERLQQLSVRLVQLLEKYGGIGAGKAFMKLIGVDCGWFRPPVSHPTQAQYEALQVELEALGFFTFCSKIT